MASNLSNVTKTASIPQFAQGGSYNSGSLTYTVTATNTGTSPIAAGNFVMTDRASVATNFLSAQPTVIMLNNTILPASSYTYGMTDANTLYIQLNVPVNPNDTIQIFFGGQPTAALAVGSTLNNTVTLTDRAGGTSGTASMSLPVVANVNSSITNLNKTASASLVPPGGTVIYTITGTYTGTSTNGPLQIMDYLFNDNTNQGLLTPDMVPSETVTATVNGTSRPITAGLSGSPTYNANLSTNMLLQGPLNNGDQFTITYTVTMPTTIPVGTGVENWIYISLNGVAKGSLTNNRIVIGYPSITLSNVSKTVSPNMAIPGGILTYNISATNTGNGPTNPFTITDTLPPGTTLVPSGYNATIGGGTVSAPTVTQNGQNITFTFNAPVPAGSTANLIYRVQVSPDAAVGTTLTNNATVKGSATDTGHQVSATATVGGPQLTTHKSSFPASVIPGSSITYTLSISNDSSAAPSPSPWTISETLPADFNLNPNSIIASITGNAMSAVTIAPNPSAPNYLITVPESLQPGQTINIAFNGTVADNAQPGESFPNTASFGDGSSFSDPNPPRISTPSFTNLSKSGILNQSSNGQGGTIAWTITATNAGPGIAPVTSITDPLSNGQTYVSGSATATVNGASVGVTDTGGTATAPVFTLTSPLQPSQTATITFTASLPDSPQTLAPGTIISNAGTISGFPADPGTAIPVAPSITTNAANFNNAVKTSCCGEIAPGEIVNYTITATNTGNLDSNPFIVTDPLPTTTDANGNTVPLVTYQGGAPTATINNIATSVTTGGTSQTPIFIVSQPVKPGQTVTLTFPCVVSANVPLGTQISNTAFVQSSPLGSSTATKPATFITQQSNFGNTAKTPSATILTPGASLGYTLTTTNIGNVPTDAFTVSDTLDPNLSFDPNTPIAVSIGGTILPASSYTVAQNGQQLILTVTDPNYQLSPGEEAQITYGTIVSPNASINSAIANTATFTTDANGSNPTMTDSPPTYVGAPDFTDATKNATVSLIQPGDSFNYWISATNNGNVSSNPFIMTDPIPAGLALTSLTATAAINGKSVPVTVTGSLADPTFTIDAPIHPTDQVMLTYPVTASTDLAYGSSIVNTANLKGYPTDPGTAASNTLAVGTPSFSSVSKVPNTNTIEPGGIYSYTISATNNGTSPTQISMGDPLPQGISLLSDPAPVAAINGIETAVAVTGSSTDPTFSLSDELQPGQTATLTFSVASDSSLANGASFNNTVTISGPNLTPTIATSIPVMVQTPVWNAGKLPSTQAVSSGQTLTYTLTGNNSGSPTDNPFTITDNLPTGMALANPSNLTATINGQTVPVTVDGTNNLTFTVNGSVERNQNFTLNFDVITDPGDANDGEVVTNTATINSAAGQPGTIVTGPPVSYGQPNFAGATKEALDLNGNPITTITPGQSFIYRGTGTNIGSGTAVGPFKVTDTLPAGITWDQKEPVTVNITLPDGTISTATVTVTSVSNTADSQTLTFNFPADVPIPSGAKAVLEFGVDSDPNLPADTQISNTMTGYAFAADPGSTTNVATVIVAEPDFSQQSSKTATPTAVVPGQQITYTLTATNTGLGAAPTFTVSDTLPTVNIPAANVTTPIFFNPLNTPTATLNGQTVGVQVGGTSLAPTFILVDPATGNPISVPAGATVIINYTVTIPVDSAPATLQNSATINNDTTVQDPGVALTPGTVTNDTIQKVSSSTDHPGFEEIFPGERVTYDVTWTANNDASQITATDHLPPYAYLPDGATANATINGTSLTIPNTGTSTDPIFILPGPIQKGDQLALHFIASTSAGIPLNNYLINTIAINDGTDTNYATDGPDGILVANPTFDVTKTSVPTVAAPGDNITYTITATNTGTLSSSNFNFLDTLPTGISASTLTNVTAAINGTPTTVTVGGTDTQPTFTLGNQLMPGQTVALTFEASVPEDMAAGTNLINAVHVQGYPSAIGEDTTDEPGVTVGASNLSGVTFAKSVNPGFTPPGGQVNYSFNITTTTAINTSLTLTDALPNLVTVPDNTNATYTINGVATQLSNAGTNTNPIFTIPGPIPANSTILVQFNALLALDAPAEQNFQNTATLTNGSGDQLTASDAPGFESRYVYDAKKTSLSDTVPPGGQITYQITATNVGDMTAPEFIVNDALPSGFNFTSTDTVTATVGGVTVPVAIPTVQATVPTFSILTPVPAGAQVVLTFTATAGADVPIGSTVTNTATIIAFPGDLGDNVTDQGTLVKGGIQSDALIKSVSQTLGYPGGFLTYTFAYENQYPLDRDLTLTDLLPEGMGFPLGATATLMRNGAISQVANSGTETEPAFAIAAPIPAHTTITLQFTVQIPSDALPGSFIENAGTLTGGYGMLTSNRVQTPIRNLFATVNCCKCQQVFPRNAAAFCVDYNPHERNAIQRCQCSLNCHCQKDSIVLEACREYRITYTVTVKSGKKPILAKPVMELNGQPIHCSETFASLKKCQTVKIVKTFILKTSHQKNCLTMTHRSCKAINFCDLDIQIIEL